MANHYVFTPEFCNPAAGWEKGQVEKNVRDARHRFWQPMPEFADLTALNDWLEQRCIALWQDIPHGGLPGSIADVWTQEQATLMPSCWRRAFGVMPCAFDGFVEHSKRVSPTCLINFERNRYSVPASFANRPVSLRVYPDRLVVVLQARLRHDAAEGQILCEHQRFIDRPHKRLPRTIYDWRHYLALAIVLGPMADNGSLQRKPGALRNGAPFAELPLAFRQLQDLMLRRPGGDRDPLGTSLRDALRAVDGRYSGTGAASCHAKGMLSALRQAVLVAGEMALAEGYAPKTHVLNLARIGWWMAKLSGAPI
jgi:hypothetical protein